MVHFLGRVLYSKTSISITFWARINYILASLIPPTFTLFAFIFPDGKFKISLLKRISLFIPSIILTIVYFTTSWIIKDVFDLKGVRGFEYGPMTVTRLGMKGELIRCSVSRGVLTAESEQCRCSGTETAIGQIAYEKGNDAVRAIFGTVRKRSNLDYDTAVNEMSAKNDTAARAAKAMAASTLLKPATAAAAPLSFPNRPAGPVKPGGFA